MELNEVKFFFQNIFINLMFGKTVEIHVLLNAYRFIGFS